MCLTRQSALYSSEWFLRITMARRNGESSSIVIIPHTALPIQWVRVWRKNGSRKLNEIAVTAMQSVEYDSTCFARAVSRCFQLFSVAAPAVALVCLSSRRVMFCGSLAETYSYAAGALRIM